MKNILIPLLLFMNLISEAQNTMYFMDRMPQSVMYNPALVPQMKFYIGLPGMSGLNTQIYNSGFTVNQIDEFIDNLDDPNYIPDEFVKSIGENNLFTGELNANLLTFGFKLKEKGFLSFLLTGHCFVINKAPSEIAYLIADLDNLYPEDFPVTVDNIYMNGNAWMSFGVAYSRIINEHLTLGITPRINFNQAGLNTGGLNYRVDYAELEPGETEFVNTYKGEMQVGLPSEINRDAVENGELNTEAGLLPENWTDNYTLSRVLKDKSFMVDFGAVYEIDKWTFSASLLNLGKSNYKTDAYLLNGEGEKVFVHETEKIKIGTPTKLYLGAMRQFSPKWNYALLLNNNFYSTGSVATATVSLNGYVGSALSTSVSYTAGYKYDNLGIGLRLRFLPGTDLYFVTDNIIQAFNYKNAYRITAAAGINISIGVKVKTNMPDENMQNEPEVIH